jgi:DNA repair protein RadC
MNTIKDRDSTVRYLSSLPDGEKPVNRLLHYGAGALATDELLACVFGLNGHGHADAQHLLSAFEGLPGLACATIHELQQHPGIGPARAAQVKAALELGRRLLVAAPHERPQIRTSADAANLLMAEMGLLSQEHLRTVLLDTRNRVISIPTVYIGSLNAASVRVGEVFREAIRANAAAIVVVHNHPSNDPTPSPDDVHVTRQIVEAGSLLNVDVLDHLIISHQRFVSMKERGLGFL